MSLKKCESCGKEFETESSARTCSVSCRNRLVSAERKAKHMRQKQCVICGAEFTIGAKDWDRDTCSKECGYKLRGSKTEKGEHRKCLTCGSDFYSKKSQIDAMPGGGSYCSKECMYERNKESTTRACECCGKMFSTPPSQMHIRTCSLECGYKIRDSGEKDRVLLRCAHCGSEFSDHESRAVRRKYCSYKCAKSSDEAIARMSAAFSGEKNPSWKGGVTVLSVSDSGKSYRRAANHIENEKSVRRRRAKDLATPKWADINAIRAIYRASNDISRRTGIKHHVDHIVPLKSDLVCGLHNQFNLQVIPGVENLRKHNRRWPDMP